MTGIAAENLKTAFREFVPDSSMPSKMGPQSDIEDNDYKIQQLFQRLLSIEIPMGSKRPAATLGDILDDPRIREIFFHRVGKKLLRKFKKLNGNIKKQYQNAVNHPSVIQAIKLQQKHCSFKIFKYAIKILNSFAKLSLIYGSENIKNLNSIVKFISKARQSADLFDFNGIENFNMIVHKFFKASYTGLSILTNTVDVLNNNEWTQAAYEVAGWGTDLQPIPEFVANCCDYLAPVLTVFRLCIKASGFKQAFYMYCHANPEDSANAINFKKWKLIRASAEVTGEIIKLALKIILLASVATTFPTIAPALVIAQTVVPIATLILAVASAIIGWNQTYRKKHLNEEQAIQQGSSIELERLDSPISSFEVLSS